jgi:flagellar biosynthesis protein FlhG
MDLGRHDPAEHGNGETMITSHDPSEGSPVVVIGSGKGGVGKSVLAASLASSAARGGKRTLLLDGSQNQGNLHVLLGVRPRARLETILTLETSPEELLVHVTENLTLLPVEAGAESLYALTPLDRARLHLRLTALYERFDAVVIDAGPGIESPMRALIRATRLVVVAVPEPASLSDAYALVKIATLRSPGLPIDILINRTFSAGEGSASFERCDLASRRFLRRGLGYLGAVSEDEGLRRAARNPGEILLLRNDSIDEIAAGLFRADAMASEAAAP